MSIVIIRPHSGPTTSERILQVLATRPHGITLKQLNRELNRPISMLLVCLKSLRSQHKIGWHLSENGMQRLYYLVNQKVS